jgi:hypothetical protein
MVLWIVSSSTGSAYTRHKKLHPKNAETARGVRQGDAIVNTASKSWETVNNAKKRKWWQVLLRFVLDRIIDKIGGKLFDRYVWPYLVKIANKGWAMVKAAIAFLKALLVALWKFLHAKAAGGAVATSGFKMVVMTCCKFAAAAAA